MPTAAIIGAATVGGSLVQANAAQKAAKMQSQAAQQARQDMLPFALPGQGAASALANLYGIDPATGQFDQNAVFNPASLDTFRRSPDYQFAFNEGLRGLENSAAARGMLRSGNTLRDITGFGQGLATQTFGNYRGALQQLAQLGAGAAGGAGNAAMAAGAAGASGVIGSANAIAGGLGSLGNFFMLQNLLNPAASAYGKTTPVPGFSGVGGGLGGYTPGMIYPTPYVAGGQMAGPF
jgi:hypothetical protein